MFPLLPGRISPAAEGLMVLAEPLQAWSTALIGCLTLCDGPWTNIPCMEAIPVDALAWHLKTPRPSGGKELLTVELMCRSSRLPLPVRGLQSDFLASLARLRSSLPWALSGTTGVGSDGENLDAAHIGVLAWLQAAWTLMTTSGVVQTIVASTNGPSKRVTVVDLHPDRRGFLSGAADEYDVELETFPRRPARRHVVRGRWARRSQELQGSSQGFRWVDDHVCGPPGAPLVVRPHV